MSRLGIIIPTIEGREELFDAAIAAYSETTREHDVTFAVVHDRPTVGAAWHAGAVELLRAGVDYVHFGADDVAPAASWADVAIDEADAGIYPSPLIINPDGAVHAAGSMGGGMLPKQMGMARGPACSSQFPFVSRDSLRDMLPVLPIHYYCDDWMAHRARQAGLTVVYQPAYAFIHHEGKVGRGTMVARSQSDFDTFMRAVGWSSVGWYGMAVDTADEFGFEWGPGLATTIGGLVKVAQGPGIAVRVLSIGSGAVAGATIAGAELIGLSRLDVWTQGEGHYSGALSADLTGQGKVRLVHGSPTGPYDVAIVEPGDKKRTLERVVEAIVCLARGGVLIVGGTNDIEVREALARFVALNEPNAATFVPNGGGLLILQARTDRDLKGPS